MFKVTVTLLIVEESGIAISELVIMPSSGPTSKLLFVSLDTTHPGPEIVGVDVSDYRFMYYPDRDSPMADQLSCYPMGSVFF